MSLSWIPKGVLEIIRRTSFRFIWSWCNKNNGIPLVKWKMIVVPKDLGECSLKKFFIFSKGLTTKNSWRFIQGKGIWCQVVKEKYIHSNSLYVWFRNSIKSMHKVFVM
jgi:hypothetical protein